MAERNWGLIRSGATFESMVTTLVGFDDPNFVPLSRPGKDDGQDVRSSDGTTVYQAKFHKDESAATAIRDAKKEAQKQKQRIADDGVGKEMWTGVKHWILITNAKFNQRNNATWKAEVQPIFKELGLTAEYWEQGKLDERLTKHREVDQAYFEANNRVFLNLKEALQLPSLDVGSRASQASFQGRAEELETFTNFLADDSRILVVHGPGGVGKSRFLWEAACSVYKSWSSLWALVSSMAQSDSWFAALVPERPTLVLIDDPEDDVLIKALFEQLAGRAKQWKIVIALRSTSPVLRLLRAHKQRGVQELELRPLAQNEALALCTELITCEEFADEDEASIAKWVADRFDGFPIWIAMAIDLIIHRGNLKDMPETAAGVAQEYLNQVCDQNDFPSENVLEVLRWVSILGPFNTKLQAEMTYVATNVGLETSLTRYLNQLVTRRILFRRGAYDRLIEVKPDVLAEYIQRNWLVEERIGLKGAGPTEEARGLIKMIADALLAKTFGSFERRILRSLTRIERIDETGRTDLTSGLVTTIRTQVAQSTATEQLALIDALHILAPIRPGEVIGAVGDILSNPPELEKIDTILRTRTMDAWDLLPEINWLMFRVGTHVNSEDDRRDVLAILGRVAKEEISLANGRTLPNDGRGAERILVRLLEGGDSVRTGFGEEALALVTTALRAGAPARYPQTFIDAAVAQIFAIHKHYTTSDSTSVTLHNYLLPETSGSWRRRDQLLAVIRDLLKTDGASTSTLLTLLVAESHTTRDALMQASMDGASRIYVQKAEKESLEWIAEYLESKDLTTHNLRIASDIWGWLLDHEKDIELQALARRCQAVLDADADYQEFHGLFTPDFMDRGQREKLCDEKTIELAQQSCAELVTFVERVANYLDDPKLSAASLIGEGLGACAETKASVREFVKFSLGHDASSSIFTFAKFVCRTWNIAIRGISPERTVPHLQKQLAFIKTAGGRTEFLQSVFSFAAFAVPTSAEITMFLGYKNDFEEAGQTLAFLDLSASVLLYQWDEVRPVVACLFDGLKEHEWEQAFRTLLTAVTSVARVHGNGQLLCPKQVQWLFGYLLEIPDIDAISNDSSYHLREILKWVGPMSANWLEEAIEARLRKFSDDDRMSNALPSRQRLSAFVKPCETDGATPEQEALVTTLIGHVGDNPTTAYVLPQYLAEIDPYGVIVPQLAEEAISQAQLEIQDLRQLGKLSGHYAQNSPAWRTIAIALMTKATELLSENRNRIMSALIDPRPMAWSGAIGEVSSVFYSRVEAAQKRLDDEYEPLLVPYWENRLEREQERLDNEEERQREERGE